MRHWHVISGLAAAILLSGHLNGSSVLLAQPHGDRWREQRDRMVREEIVDAGVTNPRVIQAVRETPRH